MGLFFYWQRYLEKIHDNPESPFSLLTPPPLLKLSIWTRANGRIAAMMAIAFTNWCAFLSWTFWVQVRIDSCSFVCSNWYRIMLISHIALFPELHALHRDADRCPSSAHVCIGDIVQRNRRLHGCLHPYRMARRRVISFIQLRKKVLY